MKSMNRVTKIELALLLLAAKTGTVFAPSKSGSGLAAMTSSKRYGAKKSSRNSAKASSPSQLPKAS